MIAPGSGNWSKERRARGREGLGIASDAPVIVTVGRQEYQKGQTHLIAAFERVAREYPEALLLLAGRRGYESGAIDAAIARSSFGDRIRSLGHRDDLPDVLAACDVFAFPSLYEGLGGAVIEAMALGLPVVSSDLPAVREVVEDGASAPARSPRRQVGDGERTPAPRRRPRDAAPLRRARERSCSTRASRSTGASTGRSRSTRTCSLGASAPPRRRPAG